MPGVRISPFASSEGITLSLADFDDPVNGRQIKPTTRGTVDDDGELPVTYDVAIEPPWEKLTMSITAKLPVGELRRVAPTDCSPENDLVLAVSVTCPSTKYRHAVNLTSTSEGEWSGHVTLLRKDLRATVSFRPMLTLKTGSTQSALQTPRRGTVIARGQPLQLVIDGSVQSLMQALVTTVWEDFASSDSSWRREHSDSLFHLEPYSENPRLFLNARYSELREILISEAEKGPEAAVRNLTAALIADSVWIQLILVAASSVSFDETDDSVAVMGAEWKRLLLDNCLPALYPDESSAKERLRRLGSDLREGTGAGSLVSRIGTVVQGMVATHRVVEAAVRAHESLRAAMENGE